MTIELEAPRRTDWIRTRSMPATMTPTGAAERAGTEGALVRTPADTPGAPGFVVPVKAFQESMVAAGVASALDAIRAEAVAADGVARERLQRASAELVRSAGPSAGVVAAVADAYPGLGIEDFGPARVVVRVAVERARPDGPEPVRGLPAVLAAIVDRWAETACVGGCDVLVQPAPVGRCPSCPADQPEPVGTAANRMSAAPPTAGPSALVQLQTAARR
jgi:hypothetical protein